jgi:hypothetical protein
MTAPEYKEDAVKTEGTVSSDIDVENFWENFIRK